MRAVAAPMPCAAPVITKVMPSSRAPIATAHHTLAKTEFSLVTSSKS
jgi:hypothetical protein